jgi:hypothetical protein
MHRQQGAEAPGKVREAGHHRASGATLGRQNSIEAAAFVSDEGSVVVTSGPLVLLQLGWREGSVRHPSICKERRMGRDSPRKRTVGAHQWKSSEGGGDPVPGSDETGLEEDVVFVGVLLGWTLGHRRYGGRGGRRCHV